MALFTNEVETTQEKQPSCQYHGQNAELLSCPDTKGIDPPSAATNNGKEKEWKDEEGSLRAACMAEVGEDALGWALIVPKSSFCFVLKSSTNIPFVLSHTNEVKQNWGIKPECRQSPVHHHWSTSWRNLEMN